ncbi:helix-turn-helix domain-containing protein [Microcoleus sp. PH2017_31_RDM_U_A]|uniref:helix-turn-helix domain-containing protein n=1 Tax=Microcoleus sp. PH2017_31_RDM_U_A TaxID=2798841 RepID=UPI0025F5A078|nr:helix-turn-helix domain-containing protein [Microcoleus sp. PH2017_31_RDM_U_A]
MLTNYVYKLRPNKTQDLKMSNWVDMLRSHYNWCLNDRIIQYNQQFVQGDYCDIRNQVEACPLTCFVSKNGATGNPWKDGKVDFEGKLKNPRRTAGDIQITSLPKLKIARPWYSGIDSTVLQQNVKRLDTAYKNFFEGRGFPQFKNRSNFTSFTFVMGIKIQGNKIYLPKVGWMRFSSHIRGRCWEESPLGFSGYITCQSYLTFLRKAISKLVLSGSAKMVGTCL